MCFECMCRHDKCRINGELVTQRAPRGSGPKKKKVRVVSQPVIEEVSKEAVVEELTWKEVTPEEAPVKVAAPEEVLVINALPCLEELIWATLQEVWKMCKSVERCKHFEFSIWEELRKLVTLKGREVSLAQGNVTPAGVAQESAVVGKSRVQGKGKNKARELEEEDGTMV